MPFVKGVAEFTRLRVDNPAQDLTLQFHTIPSRFEVTTSIQFSVISPPSNTSRRRIGFLLKGNMLALPENKQEVLREMALGLSTTLDVDISRITNLDFVVNYDK